MVGLCLGSYFELKQTVLSMSCIVNNRNQLCRQSQRIKYQLSSQQIYLKLNGQFDCFFAIEETYVLISPRPKPGKQCGGVQKGSYNLLSLKIKKHFAIELT